jgi:hypothetical protein
MKALNKSYERLPFIVSGRTPKVRTVLRLYSDSLQLALKSNSSPVSKIWIRNMEVPKMPREIDPRDLGVHVLVHGESPMVECVSLYIACLLVADNDG